MYRISSCCTQVLFVPKYLFVFVEESGINTKKRFDLASGAGSGWRLRGQLRASPRGGKVYTKARTGPRTPGRGNRPTMRGGGEEFALARAYRRVPGRPGRADGSSVF